MLATQLFFLGSGFTSMPRETFDAGVCLDSISFSVEFYGSRTYTDRMDRHDYPIIKKNLHDPAGDDGFVEGTPGDRVAMVWELTCDAWAITGSNNAEQRLQRHITVFKKRKG